MGRIFYRFRQRYSLCAGGSLYKTRSRQFVRVKTTLIFQYEIANLDLLGNKMHTNKDDIAPTSALFSSPVGIITAAAR